MTTATSWMNFNGLGMVRFLTTKFKEMKELFKGDTKAEIRFNVICTLSGILILIAVACCV
jgi:hypothetical protein